MTPSEKDGSFRHILDSMDLTHSAAHYLTAILHLRKQQGYARVTDVAEHVGVSRGASSKALAQLKERGWVTEDPHRMLLLTEKGTDLARGVDRRFLVVESFFSEVLGIPQEAAEADACKIEHMLSPETTRAFCMLLRMFDKDQAALKRLREELDSFTLACGGEKSPCAMCKTYDGCLAADADAESS
jgi:DtxR family Mn-dependent transcriptional regulator